MREKTQLREISSKYPWDLTPPARELFAVVSGKAKKTPRCHDYAKSATQQYQRGAFIWNPDT